MLTALIRAVEEVFTPPLRRVVVLSLALAVASFAVLWIGIAILVHNTTLFGWWPLDWLIDLFGALAVLLLSWLLFPAVVTLVMSFYLDRGAAAVEARDYPGLDPARGTPLYDIVVATLRLMLLTVILNLLALPLYLLLPGINFFVFLALNGYLFGRTYFEVVALRWLERGTAKAVRQPGCPGNRHRVHGACFRKPATARIASSFTLTRLDAVASFAAILWGCL